MIKRMMSAKNLSLILLSSLLFLSACDTDSKSDKIDASKSAMNDASTTIQDSTKKIKEETMKKSNLLSKEALQALEDADPYLWLEEVEGEKALAWVRERNKASQSYLEALPGFDERNAKNLAIYDSDERISYPSFSGNYITNFWRDEKNTRGISRRTTLKNYLSGTPNWETVIDIDAIAKAEDKNWVYKGASCLYPEYTRCILNLSIGGSDAVVRREYDLDKKAFVEGGFEMPESKGSVSWLDKDTLMIGIDFGPDSMTDSGYPKISKLWKRGTPLSEAKTLFTGENTDVGVWPSVSNTPEGKYVFITRSTSFYTGEYHYLKDDDLIKLDLPEDIGFSGIFKGQLLLELKTDWEINGQTFKQGGLIGIGFDNFLAGKRNFNVLFEPTDTSSMGRMSTTKDYLFLSVLNNVTSELYKYEYKHGSWNNTQLPTPKLGSLGITAANDTGNDYFYNYNGLLTPSTLFYVDDTGKETKIDSLPDFFDASKFKVEQFFASSKDGTKVTYFMVASKNLELNGKNPTIMYGYGGFEISLTPSYSATIGTNWLEEGGVYVLTNIRGGGEYGPKWHQAALKEKRPRAYEDFIAIAEDIIEKKVTSPKNLGISGGSNGGLLVGAIYTMRPDLFNAVRCAVPLLDMKRFNKLLAGASWMAEYGNPDIAEEWDYIKNYSPYHNLKKDKKYPKVFFTTSTKDDRVHPGHARKMVALMEEYNHPYFYYENIEGGHGGSSNNKQSAYLQALSYSYFKDQLMPKTAE